MVALVALVIVVVILVVMGVGGAKTPTSTTVPTGHTVTSSSGRTTGSSSGTTTGSTSIGAPSGTIFTAALGGGNETPSVTTASGGTFTLTVASDMSSAHYVLQVDSIISLTSARLHVGKVGATGGTILTIYGGPTKSGLYSGTIAKGSFTAKSLGGALKGKTIKDLVALIKSYSVYLNIGTDAHPQGEIRGQVQQTP